MSIHCSDNKILGNADYEQLNGTKGPSHPMNETFYVCGSNIEIMKLKCIVKLPVFINVQEYICLTLQYNEYTLRLLT